MSESPELTIEYIKTLPLEQVYGYALKYLRSVETKRLLNRAYRQLDHVKEHRRAYYYKRNNIYHPTLHPEGEIEKRWKRETAN